MMTYDPLYFRGQFQHNRGIAAVILNRFKPNFGEREIRILSAPDIYVRRWDADNACLEFKVDSTGESFVIRRDGRIVG